MDLCRGVVVAADGGGAMVIDGTEIRVMVLSRMMEASQMVLSKRDQLTRALTYDDP